jgi:glycosyltransferase involved in cell wall biosynthesis
VTATVHVVLPGDVDDETVPSGGNTYDRQVCRYLAASGWRVDRIPVPGAWPRPDAADSARLDRALAQLPDGTIVLVDGLVGCGVPSVVVPHAGRLRVVLLVHMPLADDTSLAAEVAIDLDTREWETVGAADAVIATSPSAALRLVHHHGLAPSRVHVAAPGTDTAPVAPGTDGVSHLVCVAALTPGKGQDVLVDALARVPGLRCDLVGPLRRDPGYVTRVRDLIERHALGDRVRVTGPLTGDALAGAYSAADLFVLPSRHETYGMVVTEALARSLPVVTTTAGALPDTVGHASDGTVPGLLVPPGNAPALAAALHDWWTDPDLRDRLRTAALRRRDTLRGWAHTARAVAGVLARVRPVAA